MLSSGTTVPSSSQPSWICIFFLLAPSCSPARARFCFVRGRTVEVEPPERFDLDVRPDASDGGSAISWGAREDRCEDGRDEMIDAGKGTFAGSWADARVDTVEGGSGISWAARW